MLSSGYSEEEALHRIPMRGLAGFLQKPYRATTLLKKIDEAVPAPVRS